MQINWDSFKMHNHDTKGIRLKFEDLSRQLFINENLLGNKRYRYLHANPNNAGLETEPIFDEVNQRWVGFQAKYFDGDVDYSQIKHSARETIEHYTGQDGIVELVYLFCNQPINKTTRAIKVDTTVFIHRRDHRNNTALNPHDSTSHSGRRRHSKSGLLEKIKF